jgi:hypothetical protein
MTARCVRWTGPDRTQGSRPIAVPSTSPQRRSRRCVPWRLARDCAGVHLARQGVVVGVVGDLKLPAPAQPLEGTVPLTIVHEPPCGGSGVKTILTVPSGQVIARSPPDRASPQRDQRSRGNPGWSRQRRTASPRGWTPRGPRQWRWGSAPDVAAMVRLVRITTVSSRGGAVPPRRMAPSTPTRRPLVRRLGGLSGQWAREVDLCQPTGASSRYP